MEGKICLQRENKERIQEIQREKVHYKYREIKIGMLIYMDDISVAEGPKEVKRNKEMCKDGSGKENEIWLKQNKVYGSKDRQRKGRRYFRISESREHFQRAKK